MFFFFSSRRRHTRCSRDWSSDVCSSDLLGNARHDACAAESLVPDPRPLWRADVGRAVRGSPALGETVVAVGGAERGGTLLDRAPGQALWRTRPPGTIHARPPLAGGPPDVAAEAPAGRA